MKSRFARCEEILDQLRACIENIGSDDETERMAGLLGLAMIVSPDFEPLEDGRWTKSESEETCH